MSRRVSGTPTGNADTSVRNVAAANFSAISNAIDTPFFATHFARRSCKLLMQEMNIHILSGAATVDELKQHIMSIMMKDIGDGESGGKHAIVIDGATLSLALSDAARMEFLDFGLHCSVCICCRVSPKQKAEVVR